MLPFLELLLTLYATFQRSQVDSFILFLLGIFCFCLEKEKTYQDQHSILSQLFLSALPHSVHRYGYISRGSSKGRHGCGADTKILQDTAQGRTILVSGTVIKRTVSTVQRSEALEYPSCLDSPVWRIGDACLDRDKRLKKAEDV